MAVVIWVFSGGGETEARGLLPFLRDNFPNCEFERKFPVGIKKNPQKPRSYKGKTDEEFRSEKKAQAHGATGRQLSEQIKTRLEKSLSYGNACDLILVFDDLDCRDPKSQSDLFTAAIHDVVGQQNIPSLICFAAPELESWIVADWDNVMSKHPYFKSCSVEMKLCLRNNHNVDFDNPEAYSRYDPQKDSCEEKLSAAIQECAKENALKFYSKSVDSSSRIRQIRPEIVMNKCQHFKHLYLSLTESCQVPTE